MKKVFFDAIRAGRKTTTLRFWRRPMVKAGQIHSIRSLGHVKIDNVDLVRLSKLTNADAVADGFANLDELLSALKSLYPPSQRQGRKLYRVSFQFLEDC